MTVIRSIADLREGARYQLPNGHQVSALCSPDGSVWSLRAPGAKHTYAIDRRGAVRLIGYEDAAGAPHAVPGMDGFGVMTDFTVADLQPLA